MKIFVNGTLNELKSKGEETFFAIATLAGKIIKSTIAEGADVIVATKGLLKGVDHSAQEMGIDAEKAVSAAALGAIKAAYEISTEVGDKVRNSTITTIDGIKIIKKEPIKEDKEKKAVKKIDGSDKERRMAKSLMCCVVVVIGVAFIFLLSACGINARPQTNDQRNWNAKETPKDEGQVNLDF